MQALRFWVQDCVRVHLNVRLTMQGGNGCTYGAAERDESGVAQCCLQQSSQPKQAPTPPCLHSSAFSSAKYFLGQDTGRQQLNTLTPSHRYLGKCPCFWCSGMSDPHHFRNPEPLQHLMLNCVNTTHTKLVNSSSGDESE